MNIPAIKEIKNREFLLSIYSLLFLIAPGVLLIWYFKPSVFLAVDILKLIILSLSFTGPFVLFGAFLIEEKLTDRHPQERLFTATLMATFLTGMVIYMVILFSQIFSLSFSQGLIVLTILHVLIFSTVGYL